ncbi:glycoside hydrolase family 79 protein [Gloeophyllum trabeum ATCC 11539]|uniref:Glycoside hydrolase family 79 protein n=1 Tax=Gloeophyllum trabeum (strain ATCC 11539 / FP-39264 / Madison 617) TaxID=670483 RepID=S7Q927_GLOTA|nr:glycoside hydrolase family 79 protein [Gloeophyllum trabeum ATCC 11539]EPQ55987.1 glycoside hydrolase family 79 protein [Gloeophyllum trabeum ATCC 11539]
MHFLSVLFPLFFLSSSLASVTVYSQIPLAGTTTAAAAAANYTGAAAYDPTVLQAPAVPSDVPTNFQIQLQTNAANVNGLSIPQSGAFWGFSIEMSVVTQVIGLDSTFIQVPFLNLMANIKDRAGRVHVRVGGNTQDYAYMVDSIDKGLVIQKDKGLTTNPTDTPTLMWTPELIYMLANVTALANVKWYLGIPFNDTSNWRLQIAEIGDSVLGDNLIGLQVANEPDLYGRHGHRPLTYSPSDYYGEFGNLVTALADDNNVNNKANLIAPNLATGDWIPENVWDTGFLTSYANSLGALAVEHYPADNCLAVYGGNGSPVDPQTEFPNYLNHTSGYSIVQPYINSTQIAVSMGKPFLMMETNTASCGGFPGISDSFGATLWALDYGLQMAYYNFSGALLHVGGQNVYYNPFTPPPTNQSTFRQWTVGSTYYAALVTAEVFGSSNQSRIVDLGANNNNMYTPAYAIYENDAPSKVALFNYITDPTGATAYTAGIQFAGGQVPSSVKVKYLVSPSVSEKKNITWAGQTFGDTLSSDGRLQGSESVQTINCDQGNNVCNVPVPAPGFALVFLSDSAYSDSAPSTTQTFSTTAVTKSINTATIASSVLATSNGHSGSDRKLGSTSKGSSGAVGMGARVPGAMALLAMAVGGIVVGRALVQ